MLLGGIFRSIQYKQSKMFHTRNADQTARISLIMSLDRISSGNDEFRQFYVLFLSELSCERVSHRGNNESKSKNILATTILGEMPSISASRDDRNYSFRWFDFLNATGSSFHTKVRYDRFRIA